MFDKKYKADLIILITCLVVYMLNQVFLKKLGIIFFNYYLNDLLAVPLFFSLINLISLYNNNKQVTSFKYLFLITIILSFLGEYLAVYTRTGSVSDLWDVICYFIGMMTYYLLKKKKE